MSSVDIITIYNTHWYKYIGILELYIAIDSSKFISKLYDISSVSKWSTQFMILMKESNFNITVVYSR